MSPAPIALSCGEPSGIGPELAEAAWEALHDSLPFFWIGAPGHLPGRVPHVIVDHPREAVEASARGLPVLATVGSTAAGPCRLYDDPPRHRSWTQ